MTADHYAAPGRGRAAGVELVYGPIAAELIALSPHPLADHTVLGAGAGTGAASRAWPPARPIAMDLSFGMLARDAAARPPRAVADIRALPLAARSVDDAVAAFVLNHLTDPPPGSPSWPASHAPAAPYWPPFSAPPAATRRGTGLTPSPRTPAGSSQPGTPSSRLPRCRSSAAPPWSPPPARPAVLQVVQPLTDGPLAGDNVA